MQIDCHYYGTYYIARKAGFDYEDAQKIAWAAQTVDEMHHDAVKNQICKELVASGVHYSQDLNFEGAANALIEKWYNLVTVTTVYPYLVELAPKSVTDSGYYDAREKIKYVWVPFHFLPMSSKEQEKYCRENAGHEKNVVCENGQENASYVKTETLFAVPAATASLTFLSAYAAPLIGGAAPLIGSATMVYTVAKDGKAVFSEQYKKSVENDIDFVCLPSTDLCRSMIQEARECYYKEDSEVSKDIKLFRIGVCMHVLADTWSHQGFCGLNNQFINSVKIKEGGMPDEGTRYLKKFGDIYLNPLSSAWTGHGTAGNNPDIPGFKYKMEYEFLNIIVDGDKKRFAINVDNKERFVKAFSQMYSALKYIRSKNASNDSFDFEYEELDKEILKKEILPNFLAEEDVEKRIKEWKKTISNSIKDDNRCMEVSYSLGDDAQRLHNFMVAAKDHRDFIMKNLEDKCKSNVNVDFRFCKEMYRSVSSCMRYGFVDDLKKIGEKVENVGKEIGEKVENVGKDSMESFNKACEVAKEAIESFTEPLRLVGETLKGSKSVEKMSEEFNKVCEITKRAGTIFVESLDKACENVKDAEKVFEEELKDVGESLKVKEAAERFVKVFNNVCEGAKEVGKCYMIFFDGCCEVAKEAIESYTETLRLVGEFLKVKKSVEKMAEDFNKACEIAEDGAKNMVDFYVGSFKSIPDNVRKTKEDVKIAIEEFNKAYEVAKEAVMVAENFYEGLFNKACRIVKAAVEEVVEKLKDTDEIAQADAKDTGNMAEEKSKTLREKVTNFLSGMLGNISDGMNEFCEKTYSKE